MTHADDELMQLWQQGVSNTPDAAEVARLAARASMRRFDRMIAAAQRDRIARGRRRA